MAIKSLKQVNLKKKTVCLLSDGVTEIPVRTLSLGEESSIKINIPFGIPSKIGVLSEVEKQELMKSDPNYNTKAYPAVKTYDTTSPLYQDYINNVTKYSKILETIKYVDLDSKLDNGTTLWEDIGVTRGDWLGACKWFDEAGFNDKDVEQIQLAVKYMQGDTIFGRIYKLKDITQMDYFDLLAKLDKLVDEEEKLKAEALVESMKALDETAPDLVSLLEENGTV